MKEVAWMQEGLLNASFPEATEGERSEPQGSAGVPGTPDPEVPEKASRRRFSAEYKLRILQLPTPSGRSVSRREGLRFEPLAKTVGHLPEV